MPFGPCTNGQRGARHAGSERGKVYGLSAVGARKGRHSRKWTSSIYDWWHLVYQDMCAIVDYHWFSGVPEGRLDQVLFMMWTALSWFTHPGSLHGEILATAKTFTPPLEEDEVVTLRVPVLERAEIAAAGERLAYNRKTVRPTLQRLGARFARLFGRHPPLSYVGLSSLCASEWMA